MVELGNGDRFFFDFGPGCLRNIIAMQVPAMEVNNIFITHLHGDHFSELGYIYCFAPWLMRSWPLQVTGPSGRTEKDGTKYMIEGMKQMFHWHAEAFKIFPAGDGYEVDVNEFDYRDENGICYEKNGVTVRHWPRSHAKDGASAYRLDWNGLSFVWTGDGRPDELSIKYGQGVDVFVTECQQDLPQIPFLKYGIPPFYVNYTVDTHHSPHYAVGYMMKQVNPRCAMATHILWDHEMMEETVAGIREFYDGLFLWGAPDGVVVNVTKDAIWARDAVLPEFTGMVPPRPELLAQHLMEADGKIHFPTPQNTRETIQDQYVRDQEIDPAKYYPPDVKRDLVTGFPKELVLDPAEFMRR